MATIWWSASRVEAVRLKRGELDSRIHVNFARASPTTSTNSGKSTQCSLALSTGAIDATRKLACYSGNVKLADGESLRRRRAERNGAYTFTSAMPMRMNVTPTHWVRDRRSCRKTHANATVTAVKSEDSVATTLVSAPVTPML